MSHHYLCSKSKTIMKKSHFVYFKADYFPTLNKKDPVVYIDASSLTQDSTPKMDWQVRPAQADQLGLASSRAHVIYTTSLAQTPPCQENYAKIYIYISH